MELTGEGSATGEKVPTQDEPGARVVGVTAEEDELQALAMRRSPRTLSAARPLLGIRRRAGVPRPGAVLVVGR
jgi:hypothetical protein